MCVVDQTDIGCVDSICRVVGRKRDRRMRKAKNNHRTDNEGDDDDDDHDNNKTSPSSPIPNRFLDGHGVVDVIIVTTGIGEEDKHDPGEATIENYDDKDQHEGPSL